VTYYANAAERIQLITGLHELARFFEDNANVPAPRRADVMIFPAGDAEKEMRSEVDRIAALIESKVEDDTQDHGHYKTTRCFGPVEYRAVFIPARSREYREAQLSYSDNVMPDLNGEA
jgi:hypothetical protein